MTTTTTARHLCLVVVVAAAAWLLPASPAAAHPGEGLTPYRYVVAPPGVTSEGAAESGLSTQPFDAPGFAGTTDNQMQLTLRAGALPRRPGEQGVRVRLDQLDPATLPALPAGLEPEGNGYRVGLAFSPSGSPVPTLSAPATLSVSAPAAPTDVLELVEGHWKPLRYTPVAVEAGFSSVVQIDGPITLMQVYDSTTAPPATRAATSTAKPSASPLASLNSTRPLAGTGDTNAVVPLGMVVVAALTGGLLVLRRRRRTD